MGKSSAIEDGEVTQLTVDNIGNGNCAFHAFAVGLIAIIQGEAQGGSKEMLLRWAGMTASIKTLHKENYPFQIKSVEELYQKNENIDIEQLYEWIMAFNFRAPDHQLLNILQANLRLLCFEHQISDLRESCAKITPVNFKSLTGNSLFIKFAALHHFRHAKEGEAIYEEIDPNHNQFAQVPVIRRRVGNIVSKDFIRESQELITIFLEFLFGPNTKISEITNTKTFAKDSPIVSSIAVVTEQYWWGAHLELDYLTRAFDVNLHTLINGRPNQEFRDIPGRHTITVNNENNNHWTTIVDVVAPRGEVSAPKRPRSVAKLGSVNPLELVFNPSSNALGSESGVNQKLQVPKHHPLFNVYKRINEFDAKLLEFALHRFTDDNYERAYWSARYLKRRFHKCLADYEVEPNLQKFKDSMNTILFNTEKNVELERHLEELKTHRVFPEILMNLIIAVATAGLAHLCYSLYEGKFTLFHPPTKTEKLLENLNTELAVITEP